MFTCEQTESKCYPTNVSAEKRRPRRSEGQKKTRSGRGFAAPRDFTKGRQPHRDGRQRPKLRGEARGRFVEMEQESKWQVTWGLLPSDEP